jgi:hypothetical protein
MSGAMLAVGCAGEREHRIGMLNGSDPLLGEKIPSPNVPTGRDRYGLKDGRDPLMRADAGRRDLEQSDLRIPDDRRPSGGFASRESAGNPDMWKADLELTGAKVFSPTRTETGNYEVRVQVPTRSSGAMTGYVGVGATPTVALKDAYDQVRADRK